MYYMYASTCICIHIYIAIYAHIFCFHFISANSPVGSTSLCFGKSPSLSSVASSERHVNAAVGGSGERVTSSPSTESFRSTRSGLCTVFQYFSKQGLQVCVPIQLQLLGEVPLHWGRLRWSSVKWTCLVQVQPSSCKLHQLLSTQDWQWPVQKENTHHHWPPLRPSNTISRTS